MARMGADVDAVDELALELERFAARIDRSRSTVDAQLARTRWNGPDADAFRAGWRRSALSDLEALRQDLAAAASELRRQAADQRATSADGRDRSAWAAIAAIGGVVTASIGIVIGAVTGTSSPNGAPRSSGGLRVTNAPGAAGMRVVSSSQLQGSSPHLQGSSPHLQGGGLQVQGSGTPGSQRLTEGPSRGPFLGGLLGSLGAVFREWFATIYEGISTSIDGALSASPGIPDGQPGAAQGRLPERSEEAAAAAYRENGRHWLPDSYQHVAGQGLSAGHCTAWANYRWAELSEEYRDPAMVVRGDGRAMAGNAHGTTQEIPRLGAMVSYHTTGPSAPWGHVVIVEGIEHNQHDGSMTIEYSEMRSGKGDVMEGTATLSADGTWSSLPSLDTNHDVTVANIPQPD